MYQKIATFAFVFAIVALVVGLSGCEKMAPMVPDAKTEMPEMMEGTIPIGIAVALTGEYADPYGHPMKRGLDLAREEINMHSHEHIMTHDHGNIMFVEVDAQSTAAGGVAAVQQLVDQGVPAIIGIGISSHLKEAFPIAQENGVVAFSPISSAAGLSSLGDYIFRTGLATNVIMPGMVTATHEQLGYTKVATIYDAADAYSTSSNEEIVKALEASGVEILAQETVQTGDTDFSTQLTNIVDLAPDALFVSTLAPQIPLILKQGHTLGIPDATQVIVAELSSADIQKAEGAAEGAITAVGWTSASTAPGSQAFVQNYQAKYGMEPELWAAQAYATLHILANAIANAQSADPAAIRDALAQTMDFPTILGNFSFDPNGEAVYDPIVLMVKDGELQTFEAAAPEMATETGIPIGVVVPLTGSFAGPYGMSMQNGFELAREEINMTLPPSMHLTFKTEDSQTTVEGSMAAVQTLVDQGVPAIIGFASSAQLQEVYPIAHESGVVVFSSLSAAAGLSALGDFLFRTGLATDSLIPAGVMGSQEKLGYKKAALIYDADDLYSTSSYEQVKAALEANGVETVGIETFQTGDTDFSAQLTNIMGLEIDALFISGLAAEITGVIAQGRELGIPDTVHFIVPDLSISEVQAAGAAAEGAITFIGWDGMSNTPGNQAFVQHYQAKYGMAPDAWAAQSYATLYILAEAMKNARSTESAAIRDALAQTMNLPTILGDFSFDPNGEAVYDPIVLIVKDGTLQSFE